MNPLAEPMLQELLAWCTAQFGECRLASDASRTHPDARATLVRLLTPQGSCYLKLHRDPVHWASEVHAYEQWATAFGKHAPQLRAVHAAPPLALVVSAQPGVPLEQQALGPAQQERAWYAAGAALARLHAWCAGTWFGLCRREGAPLHAPIVDPCADIGAQFEEWLARAGQIDCLVTEERGIVRTAVERITVFAGERPVPCHYDYCPPNWLVSAQGELTGVIDYEFARWDVRVADFARFPAWEWMTRPDLLAAFFAGYGRTLTPREQMQLRVARVLYALGAVVWGSEQEYCGFAVEGRQALQRLAADPW